MPPIHPGPKEKVEYRGAEGLAEDVRYYGKWMRDEAEKRIGHLYPKVKGPDGTDHTVIAWIWARTVKSPNPANPIETPLVKSWWLSKKKGKEAWIKPTVENGEVRYEVIHDANGPSKEEDGTRVGRGAVCIADGTPISTDYIKEYGKNYGLGSHLLATIISNGRSREYLSPDPETKEIESLIGEASPNHSLDQELPFDPRNIWTPSYGLSQFKDLYTKRQLHFYSTLNSIIDNLDQKLIEDQSKSNETKAIPAEYSKSIKTYLALAASKLTNTNSTLASWMNDRGAIRETFARQAIPMTWDYVEINPLNHTGGTLITNINKISDVIENLPCGNGVADVREASERSYTDFTISTDPPYYDNISYSNLSDYFYVWIKYYLNNEFDDLFQTRLTPKEDELVANQYRHKTPEAAEQFFIDGFNRTFKNMREQVKSQSPTTIFYAYKQQDEKSDGVSSTGWNTLLRGLISNGWEITATWPMRTEGKGRLLAKGTNALASSIVLACRPRPKDAPSTTRRAFIAKLKSELPEALRTLMQGTIAPVDLAQAAIGPGISVFSRYSRVREADGTDMDVRQALQIINHTLDEVLGEQESDFDPETRFAVKWYRQYGWAQESSGIADQLARASDTSITGLERGGIFEAKGGKARLSPPTELTSDWDPTTDDRVSIWEATVRLAGMMTKGGMDHVAQLLPAVQARVSLDAVKELGFLLFHEAEKKQDSKDAQLFNLLITAWGDVIEQARTFAAQPKSDQQTLDLDGE